MMPYTYYVENAAKFMARPNHTVRLQPYQAPPGNLVTDVRLYGFEKEYLQFTCVHPCGLIFKWWPAVEEYFVADNTYGPNTYVRKNWKLFPKPHADFLRELYMRRHKRAVAMLEQIEANLALESTRVAALEALLEKP